MDFSSFKTCIGRLLCLGKLFHDATVIWIIIMAYFVYFVFKVDKTDSNVAPITKVLFEHFKNVTYKGITIN